MIYTIAVDGNEARITPRLPDLQAERISKALSYEKRGSEWAETHVKQQFKTVRQADGSFKRQFNKRAHWDGKTTLFHKNHKAWGYNSFPTGLLPQAVNCLKPVVEGLDVKLLCPLTPPTSDTLHGRTVTLKGRPTTIEIRDYQQEVVQALLDAPNRYGMAESPTASGKSVIIAELLVKFPTLKILVTVPSKSLLNQTARDLEGLLDEQAGRWGDKKRDLSKRVTVAIIDSVYSGCGTKKPDGKNEIPRDPEAIAFLATIDYWVSDESHLSATQKYQVPAGYLTRTQRRSGVSATLRREDDAELVFHGMFGPLVIRILPMRLIQEGWLAWPRVELHRIQHNYIHTGEGRNPKYPDVRRAEIVNHENRNHFWLEQAYRCKREGRLPVLILVQDLDHGQILQDMISELGPTAYLMGDDETDVRDDVVEAVQRGEIPFLIASTIFDVGIDIPELKAILLAGAGQSAAKTIQRAGRGLRKTQPRWVHEEVLIVDAYDEERYFFGSHSAARSWWFREYYPGCITEYRNGKLLPDIKLGKPIIPKGAFKP